jgi:hypothetical protein
VPGHGTKSARAGDQPRNGELAEHWTKPKRKRRKRITVIGATVSESGVEIKHLPPGRAYGADGAKWKPQGQKLGKRAMKLKRKDRANQRADEASYQASLTSPWPIYVKGGPST